MPGPEQGNNPETDPVDPAGGVLQTLRDTGAVLSGKLTSGQIEKAQRGTLGEPEVRPQQDVATPAEQREQAAKLNTLRRKHEQAQNPGATTSTVPTTAPQAPRAVETFDFNAPVGGGARDRNDARVTTTYREGAEEFRKRQARSLELAALENVRAAEATEGYYENVAIARRDAAAVYKGEADGMRRLKETALKESLEQAQKVQDIARKVGAFSPRPGRLFADASGAASFGAAMALAAGAMESARSGGPNVALKIIDNAIKRDIAAQELEFKAMRAEMEGEATVLQEMRGTYRDAIVAQKAQMAAEQEAALMYLQAQMDQYMAPVKKAQMMALAHQLQAQKNNTLITMSERTYQIVTEHKRTQVMADLKKLNAQGTWNDRDLSYDELQESLDLAAAGEEAEAASAEEQGAALAEERLRKAQEQAEDAARLDSAQPAEAAPPAAAAPAAPATRPAPSPRAPGSTMTTGPVEIVVPEGARPAAPRAPVAAPTEGAAPAATAEEQPASESRMATGEAQVMTDEETRDFALESEMEQPDPEPTLDLTELEGEAARIKNTRSRRGAALLGADIRRTGSKKVLAEAERAMGGYYEPKGSMARAKNNSKSNTHAAGNALLALTQYGRYDRAPKGSGKVGWLNRSTGLEKGYRGSINPAETVGSGIPVVALAEGRGKPSREDAAKFGQRVGGRDNGEFWLPGVAESTAVVPIRIEGTGQTVEVPVTSGVPIYYNKGAYAAGAPQGKVRSGPQNQGKPVGSNPYAPAGAQKFYARKDATPKEVEGATNLLSNGRTLINGTYAVEVFNELFASETGAGIQVGTLGGFGVTRSQIDTALNNAGVKERWRRAAVAKQLGYDLSKKGDQRVTLDAVKTLAGKVSHMEGFKTPQRAELILSEKALGARDVASALDIGGWLRAFAGTNASAARAYRARVEEVINLKLGDGTLQPGVSYEAAIKLIREEATGTAPEGRGGRGR